MSAREMPAFGARRSPPCGADEVSSTGSPSWESAVAGTRKTCSGVASEASRRKPGPLRELADGHERVHTMQDGTMIVEGQARARCGLAHPLRSRPRSLDAGIAPSSLCDACRTAIGTLLSDDHNLVGRPTFQRAVKVLRLALGR